MTFRNKVQSETGEILPKGHETSLEEGYGILFLYFTQGRYLSKSTGFLVFDSCVMGDILFYFGFLFFDCD